MSSSSLGVRLAVPSSMKRRVMGSSMARPGNPRPKPRRSGLCGRGAGPRRGCLSCSFLAQPRRLAHRPRLCRSVAPARCARAHRLRSALRRRAACVLVPCVIVRCAAHCSRPNLSLIVIPCAYATRFRLPLSGLHHSGRLAVVTGPEVWPRRRRRRLLRRRPRQRSHCAGRRRAGALHPLH